MKIKFLVFTVAISLARAAKKKQPYDPDCPNVVSIFKNNKKYKKAKWCFKIDLENGKNDSEKKFTNCITKRGKVNKNAEHEVEFISCYNLLLEKSTQPQCYQDLMAKKHTAKWGICLEGENLSNETKHKACIKKAGKKVKAQVDECYQIMKPQEEAVATTPNVCICTNGTPVENSDCAINGSQQCLSCEKKYKLQDNLCAPNVCTCLNGKAVGAGWCKEEGKNMCVKCDEGYELNGGWGKDCVLSQKVCVCKNCTVGQ